MLSAILLLFAFCIFLLMVVFWATAKILLPWTIGATVLAVLSAIGFAEANQEFLGKECRRWTFAVTLALTELFGFAACFIYPPQPPPLPPKVSGFFLFQTSPKPGETKEEIWAMLPVHLFVAGVIGGTIAMTIVGVALRKEEENQKLPRIREKEPPAKQPSPHV